MRRVLIFSDSLAAPRNKLPDQILKYEETWPYKLRLEEPDSIVAQVSIGSATTEDILYQTQYWTGFNPDVVIFQVGLCDCLPRALHHLELEIVKQLPYAESMHKWIAKHSRQLRDLRGIRRTKQDTFLDRVQELKRLYPQSYWLSILVDEMHPPMNFPGCADSVRQYNRAIEKVYSSRFLDLSDLHSDCFMSDGYHVNAKGHLDIWNRIQNIVLRGNDN